MVELPEVTNILKSLEGKIEGSKIVTVRLVYPKIIKYVTPHKFKAKVSNKKIKSLSRMGKMALLELSGNLYIIVSFGMSGWFTLEEGKGESDYLILSLKLSNGIFLNYRDKRKFGRISLAVGNELLNHPLLKNLGLEYNDMRLTPKFLLEKSKGLKRKTIKEFLLDQRFICGIGNIYANEALFDARIDPRRRAASINLEEYRKIINSARRILQNAIEKGGTTFRDFLDAEGKSGKFKDELKIFMRQGKACLRCGNNYTVQKVYLGGRGTYFCDNCQK